MSRSGTPGTTQPPNPLEVNYTGAGLLYMGPPTTALAGYYCVINATIASDGWLHTCNTTGYLLLPNGFTIPTRECTFKPSQQAYSPPGYSVQLNAQLSNGYWVQNTWGGAYEEKEVTTGNGENYTSIKILLEEEVWKNGLRSGIVGPSAGPCGWLVIKIQNGTAYFGYSSDGVHVDWYASYPVGNATITNTYGTELVIGGPGNGAGVDFNNVNIVVALWYWNGTNWIPASVLPSITSYTAEFVTHAWVYMSGNTAVITWPRPVNQTIHIEPPQFKP